LANTVPESYTGSTRPLLPNLNPMIELKLCWWGTRLGPVTEDEFAFDGLMVGVVILLFKPV
jgi:hypothetical protein